MKNSKLSTILLLLILILTFLACSKPKPEENPIDLINQAQDEAEEQVKNYKSNKMLINWDREFISNGGPEITKELYKKSFSVKYLKDTIVVRALKRTNDCTNVVADIRISNDSIYLLAIEFGEITCTSSSFDIYTYKILNPSKRRFMIIDTESEMK